jgi:PAS domain S-box-containing protein
MYATSRQEHVLILIGVLLACIIFIFDLFLSHDLAVSVPYLAVVAMTLWIRSTHQTLLLAGLCTLLAILGFFFSPSGDALLLAVTNRVLSLIGIWVVVMVSIQGKQVEEQRLKYQTRLQIGVKERTFELFRENRTLKDDVRMLQHEQHRLLQLGERFRAFTDQAPVMIWMADDKGACYYVNEAWVMFTGRTFEAEIGHGWTENLHPADLDATLHAFRDALAREVSFKREFRLLHADGGYRWIHANSLPRFDDGLNLNGFLMVCQDVHDPKLAML